MNLLDLRGIEIRGPLPPEEYYSDLPAIRHLAREGLVLTKPVTFFVGENGVGKSTLLEAVAAAAGFNPEGGTKNYRFSTADTHSTLWEHLRLVRGVNRRKHGYFLRAESFYNAATYQDAVELSFGFHRKSHGESFLELTETFSPDGLYLMDEPEAALSPMRMLRMMAAIRSLAAGGAQFLISTHSPMLIALPGADVVLLSEDGMAHVSYEETEHFQIARAFLENPERMLRVLSEENGEEPER